MGDNQVVGNEYLGKADRIFMGYLPITKTFIPRALRFANPNKCVIHYHHLCKKQDSEVALKDFAEVAPEWDVQLLTFVKVKSYAPKLFHCVADVLVKQKVTNPLIVDLPQQMI